MARHKEFFQLAEKIFNLTKLKSIPISTDRERGIVQPIKEIGLNLVICNNHLIKDLKRWLAKNKSISKENSREIIEFIKGFINSDSLNQFESKYALFQDKFKNNSIIINYVKNNLIDDIRNYSSKFSTSKYKAFENKLVTSNQSEGFNFVIKSMTEWTQIKPDVIVLILHYLQNYYLYEFGRAVKNLGNYHFSNFLPKNYEMKEISDVVHFKDIINKVRGQIDVKSQAQQNKDRLSVVAMARFALENNYISVTKNSDASQ
jgi:hypothetical protein